MDRRLLSNMVSRDYQLGRESGDAHFATLLGFSKEGEGIARCAGRNVNQQQTGIVARQNPKFQQQYQFQSDTRI